MVGRTRPVNCWTSNGKVHSRIGPGMETTILDTLSWGTEHGCVRHNCVAMLRLWKEISTLYILNDGGLTVIFLTRRKDDKAGGSSPTTPSFTCCWRIWGGKTFVICAKRRTQHPSQTFLRKELLMTTGLQEKARSQRAASSERRGCRGSHADVSSPSPPLLHDVAGFTYW